MRLTGVEGETYNGEVRVKVGPVVSEYAGTAQFAEKDDTAHRAVIDAKGRDSRGAGNASAVITMQLRAEGLRTVVSVDTDLKISGRIAPLGGGMIAEVSQKLLGQFAECLESKLAGPGAAGSPAGTGASELPAGTAASESPADPRASELPVVEKAPEPLDLMGLAGGSMLKRLVPVLVVVAAAVAILVYFLVR